MRRGLIALGISVVSLLSLGGCQGNPAKVAPSQPVPIPVSQPVQKEVTDFVDFTGRANAVQSVDIRPRVTGYLKSMPFKEGSEVKAGELLFEIDPRPYQAQVESYRSQVNLYQAQLKLAKTVYARDVGINSRVPNSISQHQLDQDHASVDEAEARVKSYEKNLELYSLNVEFSKVLSPIDGQISRYYLTTGNLVNADQTLLTTVVSLDPIYAYFDMDEATLLRIRRALNAGRLGPKREDGSLPVLMGLQGEEGFPHEGKVNFTDNQVNPMTGSISVRGVFPNHLPPDGIRLISPGMFVRIRLPIGAPHKALLVIDRAVASDQGMKYVYVLDSQSKVQYRRVTTGAQQTDGLRVIEDGLKPDDWVVTGGLLQVRPRMQVQAEKVAMPTLVGRPTGGEPTPAKKGEPTPARKAGGIRQ
jgi:multidrug efflux system membrane fusion protein